MRCFLVLLVLFLGGCLDIERNPLDPTTPQGAMIQMGIIETTKICQFNRDDFDGCRFTQ